MTDLQSRLLARVQAEPGEWTAEEHADEMGEAVPEVQRAAHALTRAGLLAPRLYRLYPHARLGGVESPTQRLIFAALQKGPTDRVHLARITGGLDHEGRVQGSWKREVADLVRYGAVSPPACLWPAEVAARETQS